MSRGARPLLRDARLEVAAGARLRLAGAVGSGKSTVLDLLAGLREPSAGSVQIDGLDLRRADLAQVRDQVAVVRGAEFFEGSILDNLRFESKAADSESSLRELLRLVDLEETIDALPEGMATPMRPSGGPLSDRQTRRLALVRALAARPRVLLLDGALDGLGLPPQNHDRLLDAVLGPQAPWTVVVVTDDAQIAARCDRAVRLSERSVEMMQ